MNQLPMRFGNREADQPEDQMQNIPGNFYYPHQAVVKHPQNMGHSVTVVGSLADPYNLIVQDNCHGNQVGLMQQSNAPEHNN